jgi:hypothetical protein
LVLRAEKRVFAEPVDGFVNELDLAVFGGNWLEDVSQ